MHGNQRRLIQIIVKAMSLFIHNGALCFSPWDNLTITMKCYRENYDSLMFLDDDKMPCKLS